MEGSEFVALPFIYADAERESEDALEVMEQVGMGGGRLWDGLGGDMVR
jgi:hypothetical protein